MAGLAVGHYLRLDALALANHVQRGGKVLQRQSRGQQGFRVKHTTADEIESWTKGEQDGHRAKHSDFVIVDAERGERNSGFLRGHAEDHELAPTLDCRESAFYGPCHAGDIDDAIKAQRL